MANEVSALRADVVRAILEGDGGTTRDERRRAFDGEASSEVVARYVAKVRDEAYAITDEDVEALRRAGLGDDSIFELSVAAAVGQATRQIDAAMAALDAALTRK